MPVIRKLVWSEIADGPQIVIKSPIIGAPMNSMSLLPSLVAPGDMDLHIVPHKLSITLTANPGDIPHARSVVDSQLVTEDRPINQHLIAADLNPLILTKVVEIIWRTKLTDSIFRTIM
ncbi:unnamed protein product [Echinostoma caproni]|uniref:NAD(+) kinase n=1 Tax=Echinostoma caproni TaxID=27848 RepID=A0A183BCE3_9TREM|nr:unnamed protein product [Echinostoma caproni]